MQGPHTAGLTSSSHGGEQYKTLSKVLRAYGERGKFPVLHAAIRVLHTAHGTIWGTFHYVRPYLLLNRDNFPIICPIICLVLSWALCQLHSIQIARC
jgi:hypothetical protein